jgi:hypothetical protein
VRPPFARSERVQTVLAYLAILAVVVTAVVLCGPGTALSQFSTKGRWRTAGAVNDTLIAVGTHVMVLDDPGDNETKVLMYGLPFEGERFQLWRFVPGDSLVLPTALGGGANVIAVPAPPPPPGYAAAPRIFARDTAPRPWAWG